MTRTDLTAATSQNLFSAYKAAKSAAEATVAKRGPNLPDSIAAVLTQAAAHIAWIQAQR